MNELAIFLLLWIALGVASTAVRAKIVGQLTLEELVLAPLGGFVTFVKVLIAHHNVTVWKGKK